MEIDQRVVSYKCKLTQDMPNAVCLLCAVHSKCRIEWLNDMSKKQYILIIWADQSLFLAARIL